MATERLPMRKAREILRLKELKRSHREISRALGVGVATVSEVAARAKLAGLDWTAIAELSDAEVEGRLYPKPAEGVDRALPDPVKLDIELRKTGVTLRLLRHEYLEQNRTGAYGYTQFCAHYKAWKANQQLTMRQVHRAGDKLFVDYSGKKPSVVDVETGERVEVELFVAVLGASNYTYAEVSRTQTVADWVMSHVRALEYFGGVPAAIVPDQLKSGVAKSNRYEPGIQRTYDELAQHYDTVIFSARPVHPRDKAKVEAGVQVAQRWILARLRNQTFFSIGAVHPEKDLGWPNDPKLGSGMHVSYWGLDRSVISVALALVAIVVSAACSIRSDVTETPDGSPTTIELTSLTISEGRLEGGMVIALAGERFDDGSGSLTVSFGDKSAVVGRFDNTSAEVAVPAGTAEGPVDVSVANRSGTSTLSGAFIYRCPTHHVGLASQCVDFATDNNHCGKADNVCSATTTCLGGTCTVPAPMPTARSARSAVRGPDGKIYVIGGLALKTLEAYDPRTNLWTTRAPCPDVFWGRAVTVGDKIYAISFSGRRLYVYDVASDTWSDRPGRTIAGDVPGVALSTNGRIFVLGGKTFGGDIAAGEVYDPVSGTWTPVDPMPNARNDFPMATTADGRVFAIGGVAPSVTGAGYRAVDVFDPPANKWSSEGTGPSTTLGGSAVTIGDGKIYVAGYSGGGFSIYDVAAKMWTTGPSLSAAHAGSLGYRAGVVGGNDGRIYVIGGGFPPGTFDGAALTRVVEVYDPKRGTWVAGPP